ncbi:MAG TPA: uroporphyrinogen decarboxylase [Arenibaculum sp.]|nr:uroporphyrinogen decarboxylase [Arenibaculum sp.]
MATRGKLFLRALAGETCERPPFWLMRQAGRYLPEYRATRARAGSFLDLCFNPELATEVTLQPLRRYGMDAAILFSDILVIPHALGQKLDYVEGEGPRLDPVTRTADLARLSADRVRERLAPVYETVRRLGGAIPETTALIGFAGAPWTVAAYMVEGGGSKEFARVKAWAYRDPQGFGMLIDMLVGATVDHLCAQIEAGAEAVQIFDSWAGVLPSDQFRIWVTEPTARVTAGIKARHPDVPVIGFPRGAGVLYADYATESGVDALGLDTAVPAEWAALTLQTRLPVQGNLDPIMVVAGGEAMAASTRHVLDTLGKGPFVFNLGHGVVQATPPEHVGQLAALIRAWPSLRD